MVFGINSRNVSKSGLVVLRMGEYHHQGFIQIFLVGGVGGLLF